MERRAEGGGVTYTLFHYLGPDAVDPPYGAPPASIKSDTAAVVIDWTDPDLQIDE